MTKKEKIKKLEVAILDYVKKEIKNLYRIVDETKSHKKECECDECKTFNDAISEAIEECGDIFK